MSGPYKVVLDYIRVRYENDLYLITVEKKITPKTERPVTCLYGHIWTMLDPDDVVLTNEYATLYPLILENINLKCTDDAGRQLPFVVHQRQGNYVELSIPFQGQDDPSLQPVYPGQTRIVNYSYTMSHHQWGAFVERRMARETLEFAVQLEFPEDLVTVSGYRISGQTRLPLEPSLRQTNEGGTEVWRWSTQQPEWDDRYRLVWKFRDHRELKVVKNFRDLIKRKADREDYFRINERDRVIIWNGQEYTVSELQLGCIKALHRFNMGGTRLVHQKTILGAVHTKSERLRDLFRGHRLFNTLIKRHKNGYYYLDIHVEHG
jgi:hypothetical protein